MRWRAWLSATPRPLEGDKSKPDPRTRGERLRASRAESDRAYLDPPCDPGAFQHVADYLFEVGPTTGDQPLLWSELHAWQQQTGVDLDEFRAGAIVALSREFLAALGKSRELTCRLPDLLEG